MVSLFERVRALYHDACQVIHASLSTRDEGLGVTVDPLQATASFGRARVASTATRARGGSVSAVEGARRLSAAGFVPPPRLSVEDCNRLSRSI